jgi:hypothetical protein
VKTKTVIVTSEIPASVDEIWEKLQRIETLQYIASPFAKFKSLDETGVVWEEGRSLRFKLRIFGVMPIGTHTINVLQFNKSTYSIYTNEGNKIVPVWNHRITLKRINNSQTLYTDEVEIFAGVITSLVCLWSRLFYEHRQKKWLRLLHSKG